LFCIAHSVNFAYVARCDAGALLTTEEVADRLRVRRATVYRFIADEQLPAVRLTSGTRASIRVREDALERWLNR